MYISKLKLWNFRKFGSSGILDIDRPDLTVPFKKGMNILIGENDSGKSAIIDAIKLVLKTHAYEWIKIEESDFYSNNGFIAQTLRIEMEFSGITDEEASNFIEWSGWGEEIIVHPDGKKEKVNRPKLNLIYQAELRDGRIIPGDVRAGMDGYGHSLDSGARELLKCTYLKALRDADNELTSKKNSRLSQILKKHDLFKRTEKDEELEFETIFRTASDEISGKFKKENGNNYYLEIKQVIDNFITAFIDDNIESKLDLGGSDISNILEKLSLGLLDHKNLGLGTMNRLFMAAELLHLKKDNWNGLKLCMVEELEAHLHPQAQLKIINRLKEDKEIQYILTTHSPNISSQVDLKNIIICKGGKVYPMGEGNTKLKEKGYTFLKRFLDVTKSNLFFSKGNIIVEGWSEEILLPELAKKLGYDLTKKEISIINVASTAYLNFSKIFLRENEEKMGVPIAIITDLDNRPNDDGTFKSIENEDQKVKTKQENLTLLKSELESTDITLEIAKEWTLEWCLYKSCLSSLFKTAISSIHSGTVEFKKKANGDFKDTFEAKFINKLAKKEGTKQIDKVQLANEFAVIIENDSTITKDQYAEDPYLIYLVNAIKHVCDYGNKSE